MTVRVLRWTGRQRSGAALARWLLALLALRGFPPHLQQGVSPLDGKRCGRPLGGVWGYTQTPICFHSRLAPSAEGVGGLLATTGNSRVVASSSRALT